MKVKKIEDIAEVIAGQSPLSEFYNKVGNGMPFFQGKADFGVKYPTIRNWVTEPTKIALPNDILMSVRAPVGPTNICNVKACIGRGLSAIRTKEGYSNEYLYYYLKSIENRIAKSAVGSTFESITQADIKKIKVQLPDSLAEQQKIAYILSKAEALIQKRKDTINGLDELLKYTFLDMFGDPFSALQKHKIQTLEQIVINEKNAIVDGPFGSSLKNSDYFESGIPIIRINNIRDSGFWGHEFKYINEEKYNELIRSKVNYNDLLIVRVGNTIGKTCIFNQSYKALLSTTGVAKASIDTSIADINFISFQMRLPQYVKYIWSQAEGGGQPYLNLKKIKNFKLIVPLLKLQTQFAEIVAKVKALKVKQEKSLKEIENLYQSLMQRAFKGELDLEKVEIEDAYNEFEHFDGGFVPIEEAQPALDKSREKFESLPAIKSKDKNLIEKIKNLDLDKAQLGRIPFDKDYAIYRVLIPQYKKNELVSFSTIYELLLTEFENLSYNEVKEFIFEDINSDEPFIKQIFDTDTKEIKLKLTQ